MANWGKSALQRGRPLTPGRAVGWACLKRARRLRGQCYRTQERRPLPCPVAVHRHGAGTEDGGNSPGPGLCRQVEQGRLVSLLPSQAGLAFVAHPSQDWAPSLGLLMELSELWQGQGSPSLGFTSVKSPLMSTP